MQTSVNSPASIMNETHKQSGHPNEPEQPPHKEPTSDRPANKTLVTWHDHSVQRKRGQVVWFTGLSGSGKSTIANALDVILDQQGIASFVLDGDNIRHGLNASPERLAPVYGDEFARRFGLSFGDQDRVENIRRVGAVAEILCRAGIIAITAFVSPFRRDRELVRQYIQEMGNPLDFVEVFVDTPIDVCEARDPKGLYKKARAGTITNFTGIDAPYEAPEQPEIVLPGDSDTPENLARTVFQHLNRASD